MENTTFRIFAVGFYNKLYLKNKNKVLPANGGLFMGPHSAIWTRLVCFFPLK